MRFTYFQDFHYQGKNSRNRLGNYSEDLLLKLDEIITIAKENKCEAILDGGDLFESDKPAYKVLDDIADKVEQAKIPVYSLFGNHAMSYGHIENSESTGLAHLQKRSKYFKSLVYWKCGNQYEILGLDYIFGLEDLIKKEGFFFEENKKWKIAIIHALVTPGPFFKDVSHVQVKDIQTNADLVLLAHYHKPFKKEINGITFLNIGCLGRDNIDEAEIEPSVLILDTDKRIYEIVKLKSAKPAEKIFDLAKYTELKGKEKDIKEFLDSLKNINFQAMDIGQQIVKIGQEQKVEQNVINYVLENMEKMKNV